MLKGVHNRGRKQVYPGKPLEYPDRTQAYQGRIRAEKKLLRPSDILSRGRSLEFPDKIREYPDKSQEFPGKSLQAGKHLQIAIPSQTPIHVLRHHLNVTRRIPRGSLTIHVPSNDILSLKLMNHRIAVLHHHSDTKLHLLSKGQVLKGRIAPERLQGKRPM